MTRSDVYEEGAAQDSAPRRSGPSDEGRPEGPPAPEGDGGGRPRGGRTRRALRWSATTLAVLILGTAGAGYLYYDHLNDNLVKGERSSGDSKAERSTPNAAGQTPLNILLIGSDSRASDANVALGGGKANRGNPPLGDVQMLIHLAADRKSAAVVSIPRDTRVDIPGAPTRRPGRRTRRPTTSSTPRWGAAVRAARSPPGRTSPVSTSTTG